MAKRISEEVRLDIARMLRSGWVGVDIASKAGVSIGTVNKIRKEEERNGFDIWHRGGKISKELY